MKQPNAKRKQIRIKLLLLLLPRSQLSNGVILGIAHHLNSLGNDIIHVHPQPRRRQFQSQSSASVLYAIEISTMLDRRGEDEHTRRHMREAADPDQLWCGQTISRIVLDRYIVM